MPDERTRRAGGRRHAAEAQGIKIKQTHAQNDWPQPLPTTGVRESRADAIGSSAGGRPACGGLARSQRGSHENCEPASEPVSADGRGFSVDGRGVPRSRSRGASALPESVLAMLPTSVHGRGPGFEMSRESGGSLLPVLARGPMQHQTRMMSPERP
jgi:hypothetical protein